MTSASRLNRLRRKLEESRVDAVLISQPENRRYLSGFDGSAGWLLITGAKAILATDFRYIEQAGKQAPGYEIFRTKNSLSEWLPGLLGELNVSRLGFEAADTTFAQHRQMKDTLNKNQTAAKLVPLTGLAESLRAVKEAEEIELIRRAAGISDLAFESVEKTIRAGMTEQQVAWELEKCLRDNGSQAIPFEIIVASGPNAALPHARPSERVINEGEPVVIDMGARYGGYASDLSRTICAGLPDDTFKRVYSIVLDAQTAAVSIINGGTTGEEADGAARAVIEKAGYGEAFGHSLGHGVGLAAHEMPRLGPGAAEPLEDGMVFTVEPGIYLPGWGGVRIEDTAVIESGKIRLISKARKVKYD
jgi:Xaa-Pro aminopeptidase